MQLGQIKSNGTTVAAVFEEGRARPIPEHTMLDLLRRSEAQHETLGKLAAQLASRHGEEGRPILPIRRPRSGPAAAPTKPAPASATPNTARARACTPTSIARRGRRFSSRERRACASGPARPSASARIRTSRRPNPSSPSYWAAVGALLGYTLANDVSAWDIERENALYLPQSKVYDGLLRAGTGDRHGRRVCPTPTSSK